MSVTVHGEYVVAFKIVFNDADHITLDQLKEVFKADPSELYDSATGCETIVTSMEVTSDE